MRFGLTLSAGAAGRGVASASREKRRQSRIERESTEAVRCDNRPTVNPSAWVRSGNPGMVVAALALVWLIGTNPAEAQISPGPLSKAHSFLTGPTHCSQCHSIARRPPSFRCLECHSEIRQRLDRKVGLHPSLVEGDKSSGACAACHSEHNGLEFSLIPWDTPVRDFDHRRAGYTLEGKHSRVACRECHRAAHVPASAASTLSVKDLNRTFLGLTRDCRGCHVDTHRSQFTSSCERCHDFSSWRAGVRFRHDTAAFVLAGAHERVSCEKCHVKVDDPQPYVKYKGLPFRDCVPCHTDRHRGSFSAACSSCHATSGWKPYQITSMFNHSRTPFPLEGKHAGLSCSACHRRGEFKEPIEYKRCVDCHQKDPHGGQFTNLAGGGECSSCHVVNGFKPSTFGAAQHRETSYPLLERHVSVPCSKCHLPRGANTIYRIGDTRCSSCHKDIHGGQFAGRPNENRCDICHTPKSFRPSTFTLIRHRTARFALSGAHQAVVCTECHGSREVGDPSSGMKFRLDDLSCGACHQDPHRGQFAQRMAPPGSDGAAMGCRACHGPTSWRELQGFDHFSTAFALEGAHRAVPCEKCHKSENLARGMRDVVFNSASHRCAGCHEDIHGGQFDSRTGPGACERCHRVLKWRPSGFNHDTDSAYRLTGAHRSVACSLCHTASQEIGGRKVVLYRTTPQRCVDCHGSEIPR